MPTLAFGTYSAAVGDCDERIATSVPATFFYVPLHIPFRLAIIAALLVAVLSLRQARGYSSARYLVLFPGIAGLGLTAFFGDEFGPLISVPLEVVTVLFVALYWLRVIDAFRSIVVMVTVPTAIGTVNMILAPAFLNQGLLQGAIVGLIMGGIIAFPILLVRVAIRRRVTWPRLLIALLGGIGVPMVAVTAVFSPFRGAPWWAWAVYLAILGGPGILFALLVRWNAWAGAVATGDMFRRPGSRRAAAPPA